MNGKLPYSASRIIKASRALDAMEKLVWLEDQIFDRGPDGAYISAGTLAQRLGCSRETIERARRTLKALELHGSVQRQRGETASWFCTMPADCIPAIKPAIDDVIRLAARLDAHIEGIRREGVASAVQGGGVTPAATTTPPDDLSDATMASRTTPLPAQNDSPECTSGRRTSPTSGWRTTNLLPQVGELQGGGFQKPDSKTENGNGSPKDGIPEGGRERSLDEALDRAERVEAARRKWRAVRGAP